MSILQEIRVGALSAESERALLAAAAAPLPPSAAPTAALAVRPTLLFAVNAQVDAANARELAALPGPDVTFEAEFTGAEPQRAALQARVATPAKLQLRVGAQVVMTRNMDVAQGLVNGSRGERGARDIDAGSSSLRGQAWWWALRTQLAACARR